MGLSYLGHGVSLLGSSSKVQPLLLTLDEVAPADLERGVGPLSRSCAVTAWRFRSSPVTLGVGWLLSAGLVCGMSQMPRHYTRGQSLTWKIKPLIQKYNQ